MWKSEDYIHVVKEPDMPEELFLPLWMANAVQRP